MKDETVSIWSLKGRILVIAEKPKSASKIAYALSSNYAVKRVYNVPYYIIRGRTQEIYVAPAAGHLFNLDTVENGYPVFSYDWRPLYEIDKSAKYVYNYVSLLRDLSRTTDYYVNACDYDIEGSVIGYLIIKFFGDPDRAFRAKFSSLTVEELRESFNTLRRLDYEMIEAGLCRHELDWIWGINVSRALMDSIKEFSSRRIVLSAGRVQTPTLKFVVENNISRNLHVPLPFYTLSIAVLKDGVELTLDYEGKSFAARREAENVLTNILRGRELVVTEVNVEQKKLNPPPPFNLGDLQNEASRIYGFSPSKTQSIAEKLYLEAYISYPRTNSQRLPPTLNYRGVLEGLARISKYRGLVESLMEETKGVLKPVQGEKVDPAHPAIYPTGVAPSRLSREEEAIYDLIVRRFMATFAPYAVVEYRTVVFKPVGVNVFFKKTGLAVVRRGWFKYYPFLEPQEKLIPVFKQGERIPIARGRVVVNYTKPVDSLRKIDILNWMERVGIGTESTRARIIETLFKRKYLSEGGSKVTATDLGFGVIDVLNKFFPELTSVELTRMFEEKIEGVRRGLWSRREVIEEAKETLLKLIEKFNANKKEIGRFLSVRCGIVENVDRCAICRREVFRDGLCVYHDKAREALERNFYEWAKREDIGWDAYLRRLVKLRSTGKWVKEVIEWIIDKELGNRSP